MNVDEPLFLDVEDVLEIHATQLEVLTLSVAEGRIDKQAVMIALEHVVKSG